MGANSGSLEKGSHFWQSPNSVLPKGPERQEFVVSPIFGLAPLVCRLATLGEQSSNDSFTSIA